MSSEEFAVVQRRWFHRLTIGIAVTTALFAGLLVVLGVLFRVRLLFLGARGPNFAGAHTVL